MAITGRAMVLGRLEYIGVPPDLKGGSTEPLGWNSKANQLKAFDPIRWALHGFLEAERKSGAPRGQGMAKCCGEGGSA